MTSGADTASGETPQHVEAELRKFNRLHQWDPFLDTEKLDTVERVIADGDVEREIAVEESMLVEDSPYPEVRASVRPVDDPDIPVNTVRAWTIGALMCTIVAACNILLGLRKSPTQILSTVVQLASYPYVRCCYGAKKRTSVIRR